MHVTVKRNPRLGVTFLDLHLDMNNFIRETKQKVGLSGRKKYIEWYNHTRDIEGNAVGRHRIYPLVGNSDPFEWVGLAI